MIKFKSLTTQFAFAGGMILLLIVMIAATGYFSLSFVRKAEVRIHGRTKIQQMVLDMSRGLEEARRLHGDFFLMYRSIGLAKAHESYAQASIREISQVIRTGMVLKKMIQGHPDSGLLKEKKVDFNYFLSTARRFAETSIRSFEQVTRLAAPGSGVESRMSQVLSQLYPKIEKVQGARILFMDMKQLVLEYQISSSRFLIQSALNKANSIQRIVESMDAPAIEKTEIFEALNHFRAVVEEMYDVDTGIKNLFNDFLLQDAAMEPILGSLVSLSMEDVARTKESIDQAHRTATGIIIGTSALGLMAALGIVLLVNYRITRRLVDLTRSASEMRNGNLRVSLKESGADEIGDLARTFNVMAARIRELFDHLEEKVKQRTRELVNANLMLQQEISERAQAEKEKKNLEIQLRQAHKMEAIGTLAGGIAHDFNNILASILGYSEMALDDIPEWNPARYAVEEVLNASNRAKELVRQILAYSRKSQKGRTLVQLNGLVRDALKLLRASIPKTVEIRQDVDGDLMVLADPTQIHQVVMNLCTNGAQAMDENGGILFVSICRKFLDEQDLGGDKSMKPGDYAVLTVKDEGLGIDGKIIERIFDPYFTTKEVGKGSGMGLSVVQGIVKSHEGMIRVDSTQGQGTTFAVSLPLAEQQVESAVPDSETPVELKGGNERILVVDDEPAMAEIHSRRLKALGYTVTTVTRSRDALELFKNGKDNFDLVITDQTMPGMTGEQMVRAMFEVRPDIPVILSTGFSSKIDRDKAKALGIRAFLMKPVDRATLAQNVRMALDIKK